MSPNWPLDYGASQTCTITASGSGGHSIGTLTFDPDFSVESSGTCQYDYLTIGVTDYCGESMTYSQAPPETGLPVNAGQTISWRSDGSGQYKGWVMCITPPPTPSPPTPPSPAPTAAPTGPNYWEITSTEITPSCQINALDPKCISSKDYGTAFYPSDAACEFKNLVAGNAYVVDENRVKCGSTNCPIPYTTGGVFNGLSYWDTEAASLQPCYDYVAFVDRRRRVRGSSGTYAYNHNFCSSSRRRQVGMATRRRVDANVDDVDTPPPYFSLVLGDSFEFISDGNGEMKGWRLCFD